MSANVNGGTSEARRPLDGVTVLDMTRYVAGPYCTMLLADQGATVIKVEPIGGEETRLIPPMLGDIGGGVSIYFARFGRNKTSLCLDLKSEQGRHVFADLVANADVLVENFRAGVMERLGFSAERLLEIKGSLIYCSISGFGHEPSPYRDRPAFAPVVESMGGAVRFNPPDNEPPLTLGIAVGDMFPGALSVAAIAMALMERKTTGRGTHIDMAMYDSVLSLNERAICFSSMLGVDTTPGNPALMSTPSGIFRVNDGHICLSVVGEKMWARFCKVIGHEELLDDTRLSSGPARAEVYEETLEPVMTPWLMARTRSEAVAALMAGGVPCGEVQKPTEVIENEQTMIRDLISKVPSYAGAEITVAANPIPLRPGQPRRLDPIPAAGEQTRQIMRDLLGYNEAKVESLLAAGVVEAWSTAEATAAS
jgi:crotonobetainyl-CoA:carnitine CoA-transferase CaiB-like acyl-CoA transferase